MCCLRSILIVSFLHLIQEKQLKGRWKGALHELDEVRNGFADNVNLVKLAFTQTRYAGK